MLNTFQRFLSTIPDGTLLVIVVVGAIIVAALLVNWILGVIKDLRTAAHATLRTRTAELEACTAEKEAQRRLASQLFVSLNDFQNEYNALRDRYAELERLTQKRGTNGRFLPKAKAVSCQS